MQKKHLLPVYFDRDKDNSAQGMREIRGGEEHKSGDQLQRDFFFFRKDEMSYTGKRSTLQLSFLFPLHLSLEEYRSFKSHECLSLFFFLLLFLFCLNGRFWSRLKFTNFAGTEFAQSCAENMQ